VLPQADFEEVHPNGGYFHFRENSPAQTAVRESIAALGLTFGWPLRGIWISGTGSIPHFGLHVSEFPPQTGSIAQRPEKMQLDIDTMLSDLYEDVITNGETATFLIVKNHIWANPALNYQNDMADMLPRFSGTGDFALSSVFDPRAGAPPSNWWIDL
jgi:hypothetical protein